MTLQAIDLEYIDLNEGAIKRYAGPLPVRIGRDPDNTIVLDSTNGVSRHHAQLEWIESSVVLVDMNSRNGVLLNGTRVQRAALREGDIFQVGPYTFTLIPASQDDAPTQQRPIPIASDESTIYLDEDIETEFELPLLRQSRQDAPPFPPQCFDQAIVSLSDLDATRLPVEEFAYLTIGGGLGSFVWVDHLVIHGVPSSRIRAIGFEARPYSRYRRLCANSQIPGHERLRSDSGSTPDNIWGWPGYAVREIVQAVGAGQIRQAAHIGWQIFGEPTLSDTYTPKSDNVYASIDREADRIGWENIWRFGRVKAIRKTDDGRYVIAYSSNQQAGENNHRLLLATYVHLSVGYPGLRFLPDLQRYRESTGDFKQVVNAYEDHEHLYQHLERQGGTVMIRGRGIVASRIVQRLYEARARNSNIGILHLMRTPLESGYRYGPARRQVETHWEFQPFNWPKAAWGGTLRGVLERASDQQRSKLLDQWGGTTTADRRDWRRIIQEGQREGWYRIAFGEVERVSRDENGQITTTVCGKANQPMFTLNTDFVIDCTGLESSLDSNPLLADLLTHYQLKRNAKGRLFVTNDFEIPDMRNKGGHMYAAGVMTLGGPYAAVDSFLGLQYAAFRSVSHLKVLGARDVRGLPLFRSIAQFARWAGGNAP